MAILITGARGFIGSSLIRHLNEKNKKDLIIFKGDITKKKDFEHIKKENIQTIIHLAAKVGEKNWKVMNEVNVSGTKHIVKFCQENKIKRLIFLSSARVLSRFSDPYIDSKRAAEKIIIDSKIPHTIIRPTMVYGPGDKKNIGTFLKLVKIFPILPALDFTMQPIYIDDLTKIIAISLDQPLDKIINITGNEIISYKDFINILKSLGFKTKLINAPSFFSMMMKIFSHLPFSPLPHWQVKILFENEVYEGDNWIKNFNIKPTPFKKGIDKLISHNKELF